MVEGEGFEPSKAEPTDLQSVPFGHSGTPPKQASNYPTISYNMQVLFTKINKIKICIFTY